MKKSTLRTAVDAITRELELSLAGETFQLGHVAIRITRNTWPSANEPHVDGPYLVLTYPFAYAGTVIYEVNKELSRVKDVRTPPRSAAIITGTSREDCVGVWATVHSAPDKLFRKRMVLSVCYSGDPRVEKRFENENNSHARKEFVKIKKYLASTS